LGLLQASLTVIISLVISLKREVFWMAFLQDLFELVKDTSFENVDEETGREVIIALAGNSTEVRDKLHHALSSRLESIWTTNPFRLVDTDELPVLDGGDDSGGLVLFALKQGERISQARKEWLVQLAVKPAVWVLVVVVPAPREVQVTPARRTRFNPLRLIKNGTSGENSNLPVPVNTWETELVGFASEHERIEVLKVEGLELEQLQGELLPRIVKRLSGRELALSRRAPIFRNTVADHFIAKTARDNAELVLLANLTAGVPLLASIFGGGADFVLLSKNQFELSHRLASIYGQKRDSRIEMWLELVPIVGGAFIWRTFARLLTKKIPALFSLIPKVGIAYSATFLVGQAAKYYYSHGRTTPAELAELVKGAFERFRSRGKGGSEGADGQNRLRKV
jgi:hypothetical protein